MGNAPSRVTVFSYLVYRDQSLVVIVSAVLGPYMSPEQPEIGRFSFVRVVGRSAKAAWLGKMRFVQCGAAVTAPTITPTAAPLFWATMVAPARCSGACRAHFVISVPCALWQVQTQQESLTLSTCSCSFMVLESTENHLQ